jgi:hypothetical protein
MITPRKGKYGVLVYDKTLGRSAGWARSPPSARRGRQNVTP